MKRDWPRVTGGWHRPRSRPRRDDAFSRHHRRRPRPRRFFPAFDWLEDRTVPTTFTLTSPTGGGLLPDTVTPVGGIVLDLIGKNGLRVVSQVPASQLFQGRFNEGTPEDFRGNPGTIGVQTGFTPAVLGALGGGLAEAAVRLTVYDGDTAPGDFDFRENELLLNGSPIGDFSDVPTEETTQDGRTALSANPAGGFRNDTLDTGFFHSDDPAFLDPLYESLARTGAVRFGLEDVDPFENFFDFTQGVDGGLIDVGQPPTVPNRPPVIDAVRVNGPVTDGEPVGVTVTASDPDGTADRLTFEFDFDGDGIFEIASGSPTAVRVLPGPGDYTVAVRVVDAAGGEATGSVAVEVRERPATPAPVPTPTPVPPPLNTIPPAALPVPPTAAVLGEVPAPPPAPAGPSTPPPAVPVGFGAAGGGSVAPAGQAAPPPSAVDAVFATGAALARTVGRAAQAGVRAAQAVAAAVDAAFAQLAPPEVAAPPGPPGPAAAVTLPPAPRHPGVMRVVVLVMAALTLRRRWSGSRAGARQTIRRRAKARG